MRLLRAPRPPATPTSALALALAIAACASPPPTPVPPVTVAAPRPAPSSQPDGRPMTRKTDIVETLHGTPVADPYRWLEDAESDEVRAWTDAQNARTRAAIDAIHGRDSLKGEVTELLQVGSVAGPAVTTRGGSRYFHAKREGSQNQPTLYVRDGHAGVDRVLLDGSALSADGTSAIDWWYPSWDGKLVAWGRSESGSEESTLFVRDVATGKDLTDRIPRTRHASVAWLPDGKSFYYSRYPEPGTVPPGDEKYFSKIYHHVLGHDPKTDVLVFGEGRSKTDIPSVGVSPNGRWLVVAVHMGWDRNEVYLKDLSKGAAAPWKQVAPQGSGEQPAALFDPIPRNDRMLLRTNEGASHYRLFAIEYDKLERGFWKEILAEGSDVLHAVTVLKSEMIATYMHDASTRIERFGLDGAPRGAIELPSIGTAAVTGPHDGDEAFVTFSSYVVPAQVYRLDLHAKSASAAHAAQASGATPAPIQASSLEMWDRVGAKFQANDVAVTRMFATSKDGTRVPMFIIAKKGMTLDGNNPTILWGYGGFNVNQTPGFSARALTAVRHGAVWVTAILRGGGEFGEDWHKAGMLAKKQNVFDDFYACAEALIKERVTRPERLGIIGGSNGGLLVATAVTQRPELFRVGLSLVPLTDMIRYHRFRIAKLWVPEYGDPEKAEDFAFLRAYSPYHNVKDGVRYPSVLFTTAESDSRVDPMHARKMAARLQEAQGDPTRPILIRVETKAGHGAGKPVTKLADELADELSFMLHELNVPL